MSSLDELLKQMAEKKEQLDSSETTLGQLFEKHLQKKAAETSVDKSYLVAYKLSEDEHDERTVECNYYRCDGQMFEFIKDHNVVFLIPTNKIIFIEEEE